MMTTLIHTRRTTFACLSSRSAGALVVEAKIGPTVPSLIQGKRLAGEILERTKLLVVLPPISPVLCGPAGITVSLLTVFLNAGCTRLGIEPKHAKTVRIVRGKFVFSLIHQLSFVFCL